MNKYQDAASELRKVFSAKLWQTICEVLPFIVFFVLWGSYLFEKITYACYFGRILFPIMCMLSLYKVGEDIGACRKAAALCLADIAVFVLRHIIQADRINDATYIIFNAISGTRGWRLLEREWSGIEQWADTIADIVHCVVLFLMVYLVCTSVAAVLKELDAGKIAGFGQIVWKIQLVVSIFYIIVTFLRTGFRLAYLSGFADLAASIFYLCFLYRSYRALGAQDKKVEEELHEI